MKRASSAALLVVVLAPLNATAAQEPQQPGQLLPASERVRSFRSAAEIRLALSRDIRSPIIATANSPTSVQITWEAPTEPPSGYRVYRSPGGTGPWTLLNSTLVSARTYSDASLAPNLEVFYMVRPVYSDNSEWNSPTAAARTPDARPTGFKATRDGPGIYRLEWDPMPGAHSYVLSGAFGTTVVQGTEHTREYPAGKWGVHLGAQYQVAGFGTITTPVDARPVVEVRGRYAGWYRIVLKQLDVVSQTFDDALQRDGKGDEAFVRVELNYLSDAGDRPPASRKTRTFGDANPPSRFDPYYTHWQSGERVKAGRASTTGGLITRDSVFGPIIEMELFCGELVEGKSGLVVTSTVWEWDRDHLNVASTEMGVWLQGLTHQLKEDTQLRNLVLEPKLGVKAEGVGVEAGFRFETDEYNHPVAVVLDLGAVALTQGMPPRTRPIGRQHGMFQPHPIVINPELIEEVYFRQRLLGYPIGRIVVTYVDDPPDGEYRVHLQVERASSQQCLDG
jgi:hypothetical protein